MDSLRITPRTRVVVILALAFLIRLGAILAIQNPQQVPRNLAEADAPTYYVLAENLLNGTGYRYGDDLEPTAKRTPGYPLFIAAVFKIFGRSFNAVRVFQCLFEVMTVAMILSISTLLFESHLIGSLAALAYVFYPPAILSTTYIMTESLYTFLLIASVMSLMLAILDKNRWIALAAGILFGLATLTRPGSIMVPFVLLVVGLMIRRKLWKPLVISLIGFLIAMLPWGARNHSIYGKWILTSTLVGANLYKGNHLPTEGAFFTSTDSLLTPALKSALVDVNEATRDSILKIEAFKMILANKKRVALLTLKKIPRLWLNLGYGRPPSKKSLLLAVSHMIMLILAAFGLRALKPQTRYLSFVPVTIIIVSSLAYLAVASEVRFVFPLIPLVLPFSAAGLRQFAAKAIGIGDERS